MIDSNVIKSILDRLEDDNPSILSIKLNTYVPTHNVYSLAIKMCPPLGFLNSTLPAEMLYNVQSDPSKFSYVYDYLNHQIQRCIEEELVKQYTESSKVYKEHQEFLKQQQSDLTKLMMDGSFSSDILKQKYDGAWLKSATGINANYLPKKKPNSSPAPDILSTLSKAIPDMSATVKCPKESCGMTDSLSGVIIHLNDNEGWTRESIADWLESLDLDLQFKEKDSEQLSSGN